MLKLFKYTLIILSVFKSITLSNEVYYKDRIIFYVDNRVSNFKIENDHKTVSINDPFDNNQISEGITRGFRMQSTARGT